MAETVAMLTLEAEYAAGLDFGGINTSVVRVCPLATPFILLVQFSDSFANAAGERRSPACACRVDANAMPMKAMLAMTTHFQHDCLLHIRHRR